MLMTRKWTLNAAFDALQGVVIDHATSLKGMSTSIERCYSLGGSQL